MDKLSDVFKCTCMTQNISSVDNAMFMTRQIALIEESKQGLPRKGFGIGSNVNFHIYKDAGQPISNGNLICHIAIKSDIVTITECNPGGSLTGSTQYYNQLKNHLNQLGIIPIQLASGTGFNYNLNNSNDVSNLANTFSYIKGM